MKKTKQIAIGLFVILSLFVSSVAACVCSHHTEKVETESVSCHQQAEAEPETAPAAKSAEYGSSDECSCMLPAPRAFSKSETLKIEKQSAALPFSRTEIKPVAAVLPAESHYFEKPFYLSDSFYNLKSPRAPPVA